MTKTASSAPPPVVAKPIDPRPRAEPRARATGVRRTARHGLEAAPLAIRHNLLRDALVSTLGTPDEGTEAMGARVKTLLGLGLRRHAGPAPGRGRSHRNGLPDALEVALALTLQRAFVPPAAAVALIIGRRPALDALWASAARGERATVTVAIDALSHTGRDRMRTGRFSEDPVGTLTLASRQTGGTGGPVDPPRITIDLAKLYDVTTDNLRRVGVPLADLRRAEYMLAGTET